MTIEDIDPIPAPMGREPVWTAAQRLSEQFPQVDPRQVTGILIEARRGVDLFGLTRDEELAMAEKIAVEQLMQLTGQSESLARLDPERHNRSGSAAAPTSTQPQSHGLSV